MSAPPAQYRAWRVLRTSRANKTGADTQKIMNPQNKLDQCLDQIARPVCMYLAFLATFCLAHWPLAYLAFKALNVTAPTDDPRFHHVLALSRMVAFAPAWAVYRLPYWISECLLGCHINYLWIKMLVAAVAFYAGRKAVRVIVGMVRRIASP